MLDLLSLSSCRVAAKLLKNRFIVQRFLIETGVEAYMSLRVLSTLFASSEIKELAQELSADFQRHLPLERAGNEVAVEHATEIILGRAKGVKRSQNWGAFRCVQLGNAVRWRLTELGYDKVLAEVIGQRIAVLSTYAGPKRR